MNAKIFIAILFVSIAARSQAVPVDLKMAAEELIATLKTEAKAIAGEDGGDNQGMAVKQYLRQVQAALGQNNHRQVAQYLDNFGDYEPTEKVQQQVTAIKEAIKEESQRNTDAIAAELKGILGSASEAVARAAEPADLDKVLVSLSRNRNQRDSDEIDNNDPNIRRLQSDISNARQFVSSWQDYLHASNSGNFSQATQTLRNLASQESTLIPRSQIIARIDFENSGSNDIPKILGGLKTLDDMKDAIRKLAVVQSVNRSSGSESGELRDTVQTLCRLEKTYREFRAGLPVNPELIQLSSDSTDSVGKLNFVELRASLLLLVLPRYLDLPEELQGKPGETVQDFLKRASDDAVQRADTAASRRIAEARQLFVKSGSFNQTDLEALRDYTAGQSQMAASQYMLAVLSFQKALKSGSDLIPAGKTGTTLELIRKEHPEEYKDGMMEFLTPRTTPEMDFSRMPYRNYLPSQMRYMDGEYRGQGGTTVVLPIPAKDAPPAKAAPADGKTPEAPGKPAAE